MPTNYDEARALAEKYVRDFNTQSEVRWLCNQFLAALGEGEERAVRAKQDATRFSIELDGAHADSERLLAALGELHDLRGSPDVLAQEIMQARSARDAALRERDEARSRLASATDLLNVYCRENSVQEAENEAGLRDGIERLALRAASYRRERDALTEALRDIASYDGKTLLGPIEGGRYDEGAACAFAQCAGLARAAIGGKEESGE